MNNSNISYKTGLAFAFIKSKNDTIFPPNANILLSVISIAIGVMVLISTLSIYDGYVKKMENIIFSLFPQIILQKDIVSKHDGGNNKPVLHFMSQEEEKQRNEQICQKICESDSTVILQDREPESLKGMLKDKGFNVSGIKKLSEKLKAIPQISNISPVILEEANFSISFKENNKLIKIKDHLRILGIYQDEETPFIPEIERTVTDKSLLEKFVQTENSAIISTEMFQRIFGVLPESENNFSRYITLQPDVYSGGNMDIPLEIEIIGVFHLGIHQISKDMIFTSLSTAQKIFQREGYATFVGLSLNDPYMANSVAESIRDLLFGENIMVFPWSTLAGSYFRNLDFYKNIIILILGMSILITGFTIYNSLSIMIIERRNQIGILCSMGMPKTSIFLIFTLISQIIAISGTGAGMILGIIAGFLGEKFINEALKGTIPVENASIYIHPWTLITICTGVILVCLLTSLVAARKAAQLKPVECLQYE